MTARRVVSASHKSEHPLLNQLYHSAAQTLVDDVIDHVTLQLRALHINRLVNSLKISININKYEKMKPVKIPSRTFRFTWAMTDVFEKNA